MKNILVVFTGGTIGSIAINGTIATADSPRFYLLEKFQQHYPNNQQIAIHAIQPLALLSENFAPAAWQKLLAAIEQANPKHYDGIIITHGTDTLAYTAAALSFCLQLLSLPILLVSSDYPLDDDRANGLANFICAIEFILQKNRPGVFVPYRNAQQVMQVHQGTRLASSLQLSNDFFSVQGKSYLQFDHGRFSSPNPSNFDSTTKPFTFKANFSERILLIKPYPGLDYRHFDLQGVDAVLHDTYHAGTACVTTEWGGQHSLLEFAVRCRQQGIKLYLAPVIQSSEVYQTTRTLMAEGINVLWNQSLEVVYVKLLLAYGNFHEPEKIAQFLATNIAGEYIG